MTATAATSSPPDATTAVAQLIRFLETGEVADGLLAPACFLDLTLPMMRLQADTAEGAVALRAQAHDGPVEVHVLRVEPTSRGFTLEVEERWHAGGEDWSCREMIRADVDGATITELVVHCSGDWDGSRQRAVATGLLRP